MSRLEALANLGTELTRFIRELRRPGAIDAEARAEADADVTKALGRKAAAAIDAQTAHGSALSRIAIADLEANAERARHSENHAAIEGKAVFLLNQTPSHKPHGAIDADWFFEFTEQSKNVGDEEMQSVWARILADEFRAPGRFSPRALQFVRTMRKEEARAFSRICRYVIRIRDQGTVRLQVVQHKEVSAADLALMEEIGLVVSSDRKDWATYGNARPSEISYFDKRHDMVAGQVYSYGRFGMLTSLGAELFPIAGATPDEAFGEHFMGALDEDGKKEQRRAEENKAVDMSIGLPRPPRKPPSL